MWLEDLQAALARSLTRPSPWEPLEAVFSALHHRRVIAELIDQARLTDEAHWETLGAEPKRWLQSPEARVRSRAITWLAHRTYDTWLRVVDRHVRDLGTLRGDQVAPVLEDALRRAFGHPFASPTALHWLLEQAVDFDRAPDVHETDALQYLHLLRFMRDGQATAIGRVLSRLRARDAVRWILLVEMLQSTGPDDHGRLSASTPAPSSELPSTPRIETTKVKRLRMGLTHGPPSAGCLGSTCSSTSTMRTSSPIGCGPKAPSRSVNSWLLTTRCAPSLALSSSRTRPGS